MKMEKLIICLLAALLSGCEPTVKSLRPLYTGEETIFDEALIGK